MKKIILFALLLVTFLFACDIDNFDRTDPSCFQCKYLYGYNNGVIEYPTKEASFTTIEDYSDGCARESHIERTDYYMSNGFSYEGEYYNHYMIERVVKNFENQCYGSGRDGYPEGDYIGFGYTITRIYSLLNCASCQEPSDPIPIPPEDTNTTEWKLLGEVSCKDENATLPATCSDVNASGILVQTWNTGCCGENSRCYQSTPICDENQTLDTNATPPVCIDTKPPECTDPDTEFPDLETEQSVVDSWAEPEDKSAACSDANGSVQESMVNCKKQFRCVSTPMTCTDPDTAFPPLKKLETVDSSWEEPADNSAMCSSEGGSTQERLVSCTKNYRCTCPYVAYPPMADNEEIIDTWTAGEDKSQACTIANGHTQESKASCTTQYRCVKETDSDPKECDVTVGSYVSPRDGVFHEDIELSGVAFGLHYASNERNNSIAQGWMLSSHAYLKENRLHLGSGAIYVVDISKHEANLTLVKYGTNELLFDSQGKLQSMRDLYTKETKTTFSYDNMGKLVTVDDIYGQISTIERDASGKVTAIFAPTGQRTLLNINDEGDLTEVQYEDTSSYAFEYERHLMTVETEPNGNRFLHFFDDAGKVVKVIDAEQGEWLFGTEGISNAISHQVTRASGDVVTYKNHFLENGMLISEKTLSTGDVIIYEKTVDDSRSTTTSCGMQTINVYKKNQDGSLYKDPYTNKRVLESSTVTTPSGLTKMTHYSKEYTTSNGKVQSIQTTTDTNAKPFTNLRDYAAFRASSTTAEQKTSSIDYDSHNQNIQSMKPYGLLETSYVYDAQGRVLESRTGERVTHYSYDGRGNLESTTNPLNQTTTYSYDDRDRLTSTTYADGHSMHYSYDANGNMTVLTTPTPTDHTFGYNGVNKRTNYDSPLGKSTTYTYDKQRRVTRVTKPSGASVETNYVNGRVQSIVTPEGTTDYTYACQSNISNITTPSTGSGTDESMDYTYDGTLLTSMIQSGVLNETIDFSYNNDFLVSSMSYAGKTTNYRYNKDGELTQSGDFTLSRTLNTTLSQTLTDGTYTQETHYNGYGEVASQEDGLLGYTLERNVNGQIVKKVETLEGKEVSYVYLYDQRARLTKVTKNGVEVEAYSYDANGNRASAKVQNQTATASYTLDDQLQVYGQNTYRYNDDGYLVEKTTPQGTSTYTYNTLGALTQATVQSTETDANWHVYDNTPSGASISTVYDSQRQSNVIALNGSGTANGYRLGYSGENHANSWKSTDKTIQWSMNFAENYTVFISVMTTKGHRYIYYTSIGSNLGMHANGRYIHHGLGTSSKSGTWQTFTRDLEADLKQYEPDNELLTVNGFLVRGSGRVDDIKLIETSKTTYDDAEDGTLNTWHVYDNTPSGAEISNIYDDERQSNVIALNGSGTANGYRLGYSGDTNPNSWQSTDKTIQWSMNFAENYTVFISVMTTKGHRYIYYTQANTDLGLRSNGTYIHLGLGSNSKNGTWQTFTRDLKADLKAYEPDNELLTVNGFLVRGSGRVDDISMISGTGNESIKDDAEGSKTFNITYQQNALNQRVAKLVDGQVVEKYLWANLTTLLAIYDKDDNLKQRFAYANGRMPVSMTSNGNKYYLHYDQVGSLRAISRVLSPDNTTKLIKKITYDTFGNILNDTNPSFKMPFGFAGGLYDADTKLTRFGYRDYDAYTGKWTAKDPIGFDGGDSNLYGYVLGDPVGFVDILGLFTNNSNRPVEIRTEDGKLKIILPGKSYTGPIDGFRVPLWGDKWMKTSGPWNESCNINPDGTPDLPWHFPDIRTKMPHKWPGLKPKDYNWYKEYPWYGGYTPWF